MRLQARHICRAALAESRLIRQSVRVVMPQQAAGKEPDALLDHLRALTQQGAVVGAFQAAHEKFRQFHEVFLALAPAVAEYDGKAFDELSETLDAYTILFQEHHYAEDQYFFPALLSAEPALAAVVELLVTQHEALASRLTDVREQMHRNRIPGDTSDRPQRLIAALNDLHEAVDAHLALEEAETVPALSTWTKWPL